jgi:hypothetical protein
LLINETFKTPVRARRKAILFKILFNDEIKLPEKVKNVSVLGSYILNDLRGSVHKKKLAENFDIILNRP